MELRLEAADADARSVGDEKTVARAAVALLLLTLQDFARGEIPLGFATTRGMGSVEVKKIEIAVPSIARIPASEAYQHGVAAVVIGALAKLAAVCEKTGKAKAVTIYENGAWALDGAALKEIQDAWTKYINAHNGRQAEPPAEPAKEEVPA